MPKLRAERWHSSENRDEVHFFLAGTQTYVLGFNPDLISEFDINAIFVKRGYEVEDS